nr:MAG TPA: hypothetical protein [Caudoviricetes sp.]
MSKYLYQGLKQDVTEVIARIRYTQKVNLYYMNQLLLEKSNVTHLMTTIAQSRICDQGRIHSSSFF